MCLLCHNPSETDAATRALTSDRETRTRLPRELNFMMMVHKIQSAELQNAGSEPYSIIGLREQASFSAVRYPAMSPSGATNDLRNCSPCHTNGSERNLPTGRNRVTDPQGLLNPPAPTVTSACTACHNTSAAVSHAAANTTRFGVSCEVCHGSGPEFALTMFTHSRKDIGPQVN